MMAIYRKECKLFFSTKSTYLILSALLLCIGVFVAIFGSGGLTYIPAYLTIPTLLAIPLLQTFAAARAARKGSRELLFSLPVSPVGIYLGRYFAFLTVMLIPVAALALIPPCFTSLTNVSSASSYTAVLGYFLFVALIGAMEQFLFTAIQNHKLAVAVGFGIVVLLYGYHTLLTYLPMGDTLQSILTALNPIGLCYAFTYGVFPIADLVALLCGTLLFLLLGALALKCDKKDFSRPRARNAAVVLTATAVLASLVLSMGGMLLPEHLFNPDVSNSKTFLLSSTTKDYLKTVDEDVTLYLLSKGGKRTADRDIQKFLYRYEGESEHVSVQFLNTETDTEFLKQYGAENLNDQSILVVSDRRYMLLDSNDLYHYYNADLGISLSPSQYAYYLAAYLEYMQTQSIGNYPQQAVQYGAQLYSSTTTVAYFDGDLSVTNAIHYTTEKSIPSVQIYSGSRRPDNTLCSYLINKGYFLEHITSLQELSCEVLILHALKSDLSDAELHVLEQHLDNGLDLVLMTDYQYPQFPNLMALTEQYGMSMPSVKHLVCEGASDYAFSEDEAYYFGAHVASCPITAEFDGIFAILPSHSITISAPAPSGVTVTPLLYTSEQGYLMYEGGEEDKDNTAKYVCAAYAEKGDSTLTWFASPDPFTSMGYSMSGGGNHAILCEAMNVATAHEYALLTISPTLIEPLIAQINTTLSTLISLLFILVLPLTVLISGAVRIYLRKKR